MAFRLFLRAGTEVLYNVGDNMGRVALDTFETLWVCVMGDKEFVFDAKEMRIIEVICEHCGTGIVFDCTNEKPHVPHSCPGCGVQDQEMFSWLTGYKKWYTAIAGSKKQFRFRVAEKQS